MAKLVDIEDAKTCADIAIKWEWSLQQFRENMEEWDDTIELVRCKDCQLWASNEHTTMCAKHLTRTKADDYCSYGKRRED